MTARAPQSANIGGSLHLWKKSMRILPALLAAAAALTLVKTAPPSACYSEADFVRVPKLDAHVHVNRDSNEFPDIARRDGFQLLSINVDHPGFPSLGQQASIVYKMHTADPRHFHF